MASAEGYVPTDISRLNMITTLTSRPCSTNALPRWRREAANRNSPFLKKIPPELRNRIYSMAMPVDETFHAFRGCTYEISAFKDSTSYNGPYTAIPNQKNHVALMQICRQIRAETMNFYFSSNTLVLWARQFGLRASISWLHGQDLQVFDVLQRIDFFAGDRSVDCEHLRVRGLDLPRTYCLRNMLCQLDLSGLTLRLIEGKRTCKTCLSAQTSFIDWYNEGELKELRNEGAALVMVSSERRDLIAKVLKDFSVEQLPYNSSGR